jgi:hypothetical protein
MSGFTEKRRSLSLPTQRAWFGERSMSISIRFASALFASSLVSIAFGIGPVAALCPPPGALIYRYVGDTATDAQCTDNDIQSAIDHATCDGTIIVLTGEHTYTAQHLDINNRNLLLTATTQGCGPPGVCEGGCPPPPTSPVITISGAGHSGDSVLYIHGTSNVTLRYIEIKGGNNLDGANPTYGGGIHFDGNGSLSLDTTTIDNNTAMYGGGINFTGSGGFAGLGLLGHTIIASNSAGASGGGIRIDGDAYMSVVQDNTLIWNNHAPSGYGGGIDIVGPAHVDIGSPGLGSLGVLFANDAQYGGAVAITSGQHNGHSAEVQLFTTDPTRPVRVHGNFASGSGGAFYLKPYEGSSGNAFATLCAFDSRIEDNGAPEGSAIYADRDSFLEGLATSGSSAEFNQSTYHCSGLPSFARKCAAGVTCNTVSGNEAIDANGQPTDGATIRLVEDASLLANRIAMRGNTGGYAIRAETADIFDHTLSNCLLAENDVGHQLLSSSGTMTIDSCTFVNNTILSTDTIHAGGPLTLANTIIDQPGNLALAYSGSASNLHVNYVLSSDVSTLPAIEGVAVGVPTFTDAAHGDYHLQPNSLGVDYAPAISGDDRDLDNFPHDQDVSAPNLWGVRDLGAYERQHSCSHGDTIYCDGFEIP